MKNKTSILLSSLILIGFGLIFGIKYFLKPQSSTVMVASKTVTSSIVNQPDGNLNDGQPESSLDSKIQDTSICEINKNYLFNPDFLLGRMFVAKDYVPYVISGGGIIVRNKSIKIFEKTISSTNTVKYPQFSRFSNAANQEELNKRIEEEAKKMLKKLDEGINEKHVRNIVGFSWDASISQTELISLRLYLSEQLVTLQYAEEITPLYFDVSSGQELTLKDFFLSEADFTSRIEEIADKQRLTRPKDKFAPLSTMSASSTVDLKSCLVTEVGIGCYYKQYEGLYGERTFSIEWKDLEDVLNPNIVNPIREYTLKNQPLVTDFNIIEMTSTIDQVADGVSSAPSSELEAQAVSTCPIIDQPHNSNPDHLLDELFTKDHWDHYFYDRNTIESSVIRNSNVKITEKTITAYSVSSGYDVTFKYPQFTGFSDVTNQEKLNRRIEDEVKKVFKDFQGKTKGNISNSWEKNNSNDLFFEWDIYVSKDEVASVRLISWESYNSRRFSAQSAEFFSYDMILGQEVTLKDFFIPGKNFLSQIEKAFVKQEDNPGDSDQMGALRRFDLDKSRYDIHELESSLITERGLAWSYLNDISGGVSRFSVEWKDLEDILNLELVNKIRE